MTTDHLPIRLRAAGSRVRRHGWQVVQCSSAAALAWWVAAVLLGHPEPYFAPTAAVIAVGVSYGQRYRRVAEIAIGVAIGVFIGDAFVVAFGTGAWQVWTVVALSMVIALTLDSGPVSVMQAPVQSLAVCVLAPAGEVAFLRWTDALVGGAAALLVAGVLPAAALPRPAQAAGRLAREVTTILEASASTMRSGDPGAGASALARARATDELVLGLRREVEEAVAVAAQAPGRLRYRSDAMAVATLVGPLDRLLRSSRGLVRHVGVVAFRQQRVPPAWAVVCDELAALCRTAASEVERHGTAASVRESLQALALTTAVLERPRSVVVQALLVHLRTVLVDLLVLTGMSEADATGRLPSLDAEDSDDPPTEGCADVHDGGPV